KRFAALAPLLDGIMPAHVVYPAVGEQPACFARRWLQDILRVELAFEGVIFSGDLTMAGPHAEGARTRRVDAALTSGCDMLLVCNDRAASEQALGHVQRVCMQPSVRPRAMLARRHVNADYMVRPDWQASVGLLRDAGLL